MLLLGHGHHQGLLTVGLTYSARKKMILQYKPQSEHAMRLRCMWQVTPYQYRQLPKAIREALALWSKGYALWSNGYALCSKGYAEHRAELDAWHARYCLAAKTPDGCPWNGERLAGVGN